MPYNFQAAYENELGRQNASEGVFMLTTMLQYKKQVEKIKIVERAFSPSFSAQD
jgi:hypothetical protein